MRPCYAHVCVTRQRQQRCQSDRLRCSKALRLLSSGPRGQLVNKGKHVKGHALPQHSIYATTTHTNTVPSLQVGPIRSYGQPCQSIEQAGTRVHWAVPRHATIDASQPGRKG
nr:unnamed protein product [Digitaria exilis]